MKKDQINPVALICLVAATCCMFCLLKDNNLPFSINCVLASMDHWILHWHVLVVGLLPIYVAFMVFSAGIIGLHFGNNLQGFLTQIVSRSQYLKQS